MALLKKLDDRSQSLVHLGIEPGSKAYRLYDPDSKRIVVSRDVFFDEKACWNWRGDDKDEQSGSGMFHMIWGSTQDEGSGPYISGTQQENTTPETEHQEDDSESIYTQEEQSAEQGTTRSSRQVNKPSYLKDYILLAEIEYKLLLLSINDEPINFQEAKRSKQWTNACEFEIDSINKNRTWKLVDKPP